MMQFVKSLGFVLGHPTNRNKKIAAFFRVLWWKYNQVFIKQPLVMQLTKEMRCICYPDSSIGGLVVYTRLPEYHDMRFLYSYLKNDDIVIDVGCNIGVITLIAASKISKGKIYSFEPTPSAYLRLKENILINSKTSVIMPYQQMVSDVDGELSFIEEKHSELNHIGHKVFETKTVSKNTVRSTTLDRFLKSKKVEKVSVLNIDVEGAELLVLRGSEKYLKDNKIEIIIFEVNNNMMKYGYNLHDLLGYLKKMGFKIYKSADEAKLLRFRDWFITNNTSAFNLIAVNKKLSRSRIIKHLR